MPPIPNFFTNGLLCRPMFDKMNDVDGYSKDLSGVIASAYDWIWNTGFNHDLTENFYHVIKQKKPVKLMSSYLNLGQNVNTHGYYRGMTPTHIQGVLRDWESLDLENILDLSLDPLQHQLTIKGKLIKIGPTEFKILHLFIKNLNKVFSRNQIMDKVWGNKSEIDDRTVDVHIKRIRACLANDGYDKIIRTIRGEGYSVSEKHLS